MWRVHNFFLRLQCSWPFVKYQLNTYTGRELGLRRLTTRIAALELQLKRTYLAHIMPKPLLGLIGAYAIDEEDPNPIQWFYEHLDTDDRRFLLHHMLSL